MSREDSKHLRVEQLKNGSDNCPKKDRALRESCQQEEGRYKRDVTQRRLRVVRR